MIEKFRNNPQENQLEEEKRKFFEKRRKILKELREIAEGEVPETEKNWDLIWVLSGPEKNIAIESTKKNRNESRERLETGLKIAKEVTALRLKKNIEDITIEDVSENGPNVFWNAKDEANNNFRQRIEEGVLEKEFNFPREKMIISPNLGIKHTGHQFERFPKELEENSEKIVVVSDIYHLPRVARYFQAEYNMISPEKTVLYPSEPRQVPVGKALGETKKIPKYIQDGILPPEKEE